jgi:hypothetical protein
MLTRTAWMLGWGFLALMLVTGFPAVPDPSSEVCAKVREARKRFAHYLDPSSSQSKLELLAAEKKLLYTRMGYPLRTVEAMMADTYRSLEDGRRRVQEAKTTHDRLADDLIGKVETAWPPCEATQ